MSSTTRNASPARAAMQHGGALIAAWLCLCPLLALAATWQIALTLAVCLLIATTVATVGTGLLQRPIPSTLRLPIAAVIAGTVAVLEQLALATWWPALATAVAPWLVLVAGLAVLVCCNSDNKETFDFVHNVRFALVLSGTLLVIGVARDGFGHVFLLASTPIGALVLLALLVGVLVLLALLLAGVNFVLGGSTGSSHLPALSSLDSGLRRNDEQPRSAAGRRRDDEQSPSSASTKVTR